MFKTPESYPGNWVLRYKNSFPAKVAQRDGPEVRSIVLALTACV